MWVLMGAQSYAVEYTGVRKDGSRFPISVFTSPIVDKQSRKVTGFRGAVADNTERREMEERYKTLVENVNDCIWEANAEGVITYCSPRSLDHIGYPGTSLKGRRPIDLAPPEKFKEYSEMFSRALKEKKTFNGISFEMMHKSGYPVSLEVSGVPVVSSTGEVTGYRGISRDVSERKRAEEALIQVNKKLNLLSNVTRHDILNQLSILLTYLGISAETVTDPVLSDYIARSLRAADSIRQQILFTRDYQDVGVNAPQWQDLAATWQKAAASAGQASRAIASSSSCIVQSPTPMGSDSVPAEDPPGESAMGLSSAPSPEESPAGSDPASTFSSSHHHSLQKNFPPDPHRQWLLHFSVLHDLSCDGLSVYADPLLGKVFSNLIENVARHGGNATMVRLSCHQSPDGMVIVLRRRRQGDPRVQEGDDLRTRVWEEHRVRPLPRPRDPLDHRPLDPGDRCGGEGSAVRDPGSSRELQVHRHKPDVNVRENTNFHRPG